jgi:hypothetical protein
MMGQLYSKILTHMSPFDIHNNFMSSVVYYAKILGSNFVQRRWESNPATFTSGLAFFSSMVYTFKVPYAIISFLIPLLTPASRLIL